MRGSRKAKTAFETFYGVFMTVQKGLKTFFSEDCMTVYACEKDENWKIITRKICPGDRNTQMGFQIEPFLKSIVFKLSVYSKKSLRLVIFH